MIRKLLLLLALLMLPGVAHAEWYEASSAHFVVYGNDRPERLKKFADDLERFDQAMRALRRMPNEPVGKANRVIVYMLPTVAAVAKLHGDKLVGGFYIPRAGGSTAFVPKRGDGPNDDMVQIILFHEYTHHLMFSVYAHAAFPAWVVEGWAEFHSTAQIKKDGGVMFGYAPANRAFGLLSGNPLPLERILSADTSNLNPEQTDALYGRGWALTHYLTFEPSRKGQLTQYLAEINAGKSAAEAAKVFGDLRVLHRELERFLNASRISGYPIPASAITVGEITVRKLTDGEAATMDVRIRSKRGVDETTAPAVYAAAKKAAAPFPNDPGAQIVLAEAAYDAGDYAECEAAADRAIAVNANAADAFVYKAMARMAVADKKDDDTRETWRGIRAIIAAANKIDPDDPEPLILYFRSYGEARQAPTQIAKDGLYRAFELAPYDSGLRLNVAQMLIYDGKPAEARILLMPLAFNPHGGGASQAAKQMIARIDSAAKPPKAATN
ncbi:MAG: hypothetical protein ACAH11_08135 [Sphingomonas sp.]